MPEFRFLVSFMGEQKASRQSHLILGAHLISRSFIKRKKASSWGTFPVLFMKTKTASIHTGAGKYTEMKIRVKILPVMVGFCKRSQQLQNQENLVFVKKNQAE